MTEQHKALSATRSRTLVDNTSHECKLAECSKTAQVHYLFLTLQEFEDALRLIVRTEKSPKEEYSLNFWPCLSRITAPPPEW